MNRLNAMIEDKYTIRISDALEDLEWDAFVTRVPNGHHVQTSLWARVKNVLGWQVARVVVAEHEEIVGGGQLLIRSAGRVGKVGYVTKGPLNNSGDDRLTEWLIHRLCQLGKTYHLRYLAIQPPNDDYDMAILLDKAKFKPSWIEVAATASILIDLTQDLEILNQNLKRQTRQNIRRSQRMEIKVREGTEGDLDTFYRVHVSTSERQQFVPYPKEYFATMWQSLGSIGCISMIVSEYRGNPVSALLLVPFGNTVIAKTFGWSGEHGDLRPNEAVFWGAIRWSKEHGYHCFDMEGIDPAGAKVVLNHQSLPEELRNTPDFFKSGFGGQVVLYPPAYDYVYNPVLRSLYRIFFSPKMQDWPLVKNMMNRVRQQ
jgi:lipid II:glycine glycyltransferase (peptidoglycan interpeptide bridge formation enzyme)